MKGLKSPEPFGRVSVPPLSSGELTARYQASDWASLHKSWEIVMYWTVPGSGEPVELSSVTLSLRADDYLQGEQAKTWSDVMEEVLRDRSEAWKRLAEL